MQFSIRTDPPASTDCAILPIFQSGTLTRTTRKFDKANRGRVARAIRAGDVSGKPGQTLLLRDMAGGAKNLLLVGCGAETGFGPKQIARALTAAAQTLSGTSIKTVASCLGADPLPAAESYDIARATVQALREADYRFDELKSNADKPPARIGRTAIVVAASEGAADARRGVADAIAIADGVDLARNLGNRPPNVCTPSHLADTARALAREHSKLRARALTEADMKKLGMGALLSVTSGAQEPARLIVLEYRGGKSGDAPVALCGKGVTFDTGGISLKPPPKMDEMKFDMCGAAAVLGTMCSIAKLDLPLNVMAFVPACENMPGGRATRPGDIVTSMSGQTIEILNTDAEGRLILCDAITYARSFKPRCIIDVATLTGACVIALGALYTAVFSRDESLAGELIAAGRRSLDEAWRMPVDEEYGESLRSNFADFANAGSREGGASVAAQFLSRFVDDVPWAHLDIAGVAWKQNAAKGATGRPVSLLVDYLIAVAG